MSASTVIRLLAAFSESFVHVTRSSEGRIVMPPFMSCSMMRIEGLAIERSAESHPSTVGFDTLHMDASHARSFPCSLSQALMDSAVIIPGA